MQLSLTFFHFRIINGHISRIILLSLGLDFTNSLSWVAPGTHVFYHLISTSDLADRKEGPHIGAAVFGRIPQNGTSASGPTTSPPSVSFLSSSSAQKALCSALCATCAGLSAFDDMRCSVLPVPHALRSVPYASCAVVRNLEARSGDGTISFIILLTCSLRNILSTAPEANEQLFRRYILSASKALSHVHNVVLPLHVLPRLIDMAQFLSVEEEAGGMPAWREVTMLITHTHLSTCMTKELAMVLTHLICEMVAGTMDTMRPHAPAFPDPLAGMWHCAVQCLAAHVPVVALAGGPVQESTIASGLLLDCVPMSASMPTAIAQPHGMVVLTVPLFDFIKGPDGEPIGNAADAFSASANFDANAQSVLAYLENYALLLFKALRAQGIRLVFCTHRLPDLVATACLQHGVVAVHCVSDKNAEQLCGNAGVLGIGELPTLEAMSGFTVPEAHVAAVKAFAMVSGVGNSLMQVHLSDPRRHAHTLVLRCPAQILCAEYTRIVERAFIHLSSATRFRHQNHQTDAGVPGVWVTGGGAAPYIRGLVALRHAEPLLQPFSGHPDSLATLRAVVRGVAQGLHGVARALARSVHGGAQAAACGRDLRCIEAVVREQTADAGSNAALVATVNTPALIAFEDVIATEGDGLQITSAFQPVDALKCGVYEPLGAVVELLGSVLETLPQLLRVDALLPALRAPEGGAEDDGADF